MAVDNACLDSNSEFPTVRRPGNHFLYHRHGPVRVRLEKHITIQWEIKAETIHSQASIDAAMHVLFTALLL